MHMTRISAYRDYTVKKANTPILMTMLISFCYTFHDYIAFSINIRVFYYLANPPHGRA